MGKRYNLKYHTRTQVCLCVCGAHMYIQVHVCATRVCVALPCTRACLQDMTRTHVKMKRQEQNGTVNVCYPPANVCCFRVFVCKHCFRM